MGILSRFIENMMGSSVDDASFYQREPILLEPPKSKTKPEEALTRLVQMDIEMYPEAWTFEETVHVNRRYFVSRLQNKQADITVDHNTHPSLHENIPKCGVNGIEIGVDNWKKILKTWQDREIGTILTRLLDRVEQVTTVEVEEIERTAIENTLFQPDHLETLFRTIQELKMACNNAEAEAEKQKKAAKDALAKAQDSNARLVAERGKYMKFLNPKHNHIDPVTFEKNKMQAQRLAREFIKKKIEPVETIKYATINPDPKPVIEIDLGDLLKEQKNGLELS